MVALPLLLGWLALAADPTPSGLAASGYLPTGSPVDLHDLGRLARLRDPRVRVVVHETSIPRGGRDETGGTVIAEAHGPGIIRRIASATRAGTAARDAGHIKIFLDGQATPALDIGGGELFSGRHPHFPGPLVEAGPAGAICHVPIAFRDGCKVVVVGGGDRPYQVDVLTLPDAEGVRTFTATPTEAERLDLERARRLWSNPETIEAPAGMDMEPAVFAVEGEARSMQRLLFPAGPRTIRSLEVVPTPATADAWRSVRLRLIWDGEDPAAAGVDLPLGLAFGQAAGAGPYRSVMTGKGEAGWYNRFPMPYRRQALLQIDTERPIRGTIRIRSTAGVDADAGYFHAAARKAPAESGVPFEWLNDRGRGHYVGAFWEVEHEGRPDAWPKGPIQFAVDGRAAFPGENRGEFPTALPGLSGGIDRPVTYPLHGVTALRTEGEAMRMAAYRWHLADPVPYARSVSATSSRRGGVDTLAAVFWYSERPGP